MRRLVTGAISLAILGGCLAMTAPGPGDSGRAPSNAVPAIGGLETGPTGLVESSLAHLRDLVDVTSGSGLP